MSGRIRFANQLRGVAALSVAASHLIGVYWALPEVVSAATYSPVQQGGLPGLYWFVSRPWFSAGPFGVAVFFLISGMVVPFSLEKHSRLSFIGARLLRIYPTYVAALLIEYAVLRVAAELWHRPFYLSWQVLLANCLLVYDVMGIASIDLVNWTLSVELKFYLLAVLIMPLILRGSALGLVGVAAVIYGLNASIALGWVGDFTAPPSSPSYTFSSHSLCLIFMLIGTAFNLHLRNLLRSLGLVATVGALLTLFFLTWRVSVWNTQFPAVTVNYGYAVLLFAGLYTVRRFVPPNRLLDGMAAISFPFYVLHSLTGYSILRALMVGLHWPYEVSLALTFSAVLLIAWVLHVWVEVPTTRAGQALANLQGVKLRHKIV